MLNYVEIPVRQQWFIIISGFLLLLIVIELVRQRKILEQYSAIWITIGVLSLLFVWFYPYIQRFTLLIGAGQTTSTVLFSAIFFLLLMNLQFSVKITDFSFKIKDAIQEITLLSNEINRLKNELHQVRLEEKNLQTEKTINL